MNAFGFRRDPNPGSVQGDVAEIGRLHRGTQCPLNGAGRQAAAFNLQHHVEIAHQGLALRQRSQVETPHAGRAAIARGALGSVEATFERHLPGRGAQVRAKPDVVERPLRTQVQVKLPPQVVPGDQAADFGHIERLQPDLGSDGLSVAAQHQVQVGLGVAGLHVHFFNLQLRRRDANGALQPGESHLGRVRPRGEFLDRQVKTRLVGPARKDHPGIRYGRNALQEIQGQAAAAVLDAKSPQLDAKG